MSRPLTRREFVSCAAAALAGRGLIRAQGIGRSSGRSTVALVSGNDRGQNVLNALRQLDAQIAPLIRQKNSVLIKPNVVLSDLSNPLSTTHADALRGILEYLAPFHKPTVIAEAGAYYTTQGFSNYGYYAVCRQYGLPDPIDLNDEGQYVIQQVVDKNLQLQPIRAAARLFDADTFIISSAMLKTHDRVVATGSVKNMAMGTPLHAPGEYTWWQWSDKPKMHDTYRLANVNICQMALRQKPYWGVAVIDGYEGMEGNGPCWGTGVPSRVAIASTDFVAADRVAVECMGVDPGRVGYLNYAWNLGVGQYDLSQIDVDSALLQSVKRTYRLHDTALEQLEWMQPFPFCQAPAGGAPWPGRRM